MRIPNYVISPCSPPQPLKAAVAVVLLGNNAAMQCTVMGNNVLEDWQMLGYDDTQSDCIQVRNVSHLKLAS